MHKKSQIQKIFALLLCLLLCLEQSGFAQALPLPAPLVQDTFRPLHLRYLSYDTLNNNFRLLLDKGSLRNPKPEEITDTTKQLLNYFSVGLALPSETFWVNLRPDGESNIIDSELAKTDMGRVMLEADLQLKKDTANSTSPNSPEGKAYWDKLYKKAEELFGSENVTIPTLTRVWIVPDEIILSETAGEASGTERSRSAPSAYIYKATLKVLLEQDYLSRQANSEQAGSRTLIDGIAGKDSALYNFSNAQEKALNEYSSQLFRETIIPKLTKEVNASKRYAPLRQVYYSLIMAEWFKARFSDKKGLSPKGTVPELINSRNLTGLTSKAPWSKIAYFKAYQKSALEGEYNIQEAQDAAFSLFHQTTKQYICGGVLFNFVLQNRTVGDRVKVIIPESLIPDLGGMAYKPDTETSVYSGPSNYIPSAETNQNAIGIEVKGSEIEITQPYQLLGMGEMKSLGIREPMDEDVELDLSARHTEFESLASSIPVEDVFGTQARVVKADLGNSGAYHFNSAKYGLIIVVNSKHPDIWEEGKFHEAREVHWMSKGFSQHEAHVIASAEQVQGFSKNNNLTPYHLSQIESMSAEQLQAIQREDGKLRQWHHSVLERANKIGANNIDIQKIKDYEKELRIVAIEEAFNSGDLLASGINTLNKTDVTKPSDVSRFNSVVTNFDICLLAFLTRVPRAILSGEDWGIYRVSAEGIEYRAAQEREFVPFTEEGKRLFSELLRRSEEEYFSMDIDRMVRGRLMHPFAPLNYSLAQTLFERGATMVAASIKDYPEKAIAFISESELEDKNGPMQFDVDSLRILMGLLKNVPNILIKGTPRDDWFWIPKEHGIEFVNRKTGEREFVEFTSDSSVVNLPEAKKIREILQILSIIATNKALNELDELALYNKQGLLTEYDRMRVLIEKKHRKFFPLTYDDYEIYGGVARRSNIATFEVVSYRFSLRELKLIYAVLASLPQAILAKGNDHYFSYRPTYLQNFVQPYPAGYATYVFAPLVMRRAGYLRNIIKSEEVSLYLEQFDDKYLVELSYVRINLHEFAHKIYKGLTDKQKKVYSQISWDMSSWDHTVGVALLKNDEAQSLEKSHFIITYPFRDNTSSEDFADHFTAYILFGPQFRAEAQRYPSIKAKYEFMREQVFNGFGYQTNFDFGRTILADIPDSFGEKNGEQNEDASSAGLEGQLKLHTDVELATRGIAALMVLIQLIAPRLSAELKEIVLEEIENLREVYSGVTAEIGGVRATILSRITSESIRESFIKAIEADSNFIVIKYGEHYSIINIEAAARIMRANPDYFPREALLNPTQWMKDNPQEWHFAGEIEEIRFGLLSGFPRSAVEKFRLYWNAVDKFNDSINNLTPEEISFFRQKIITGREFTPEEKVRVRSMLNKLGIFSPEEISLLADAHSVDNSIIQFLRFDKSDDDWAEDLEKIFFAAVKSSGYDNLGENKEKKGDVSDLSRGPGTSAAGQHGPISDVDPASGGINKIINGKQYMVNRMRQGSDGKPEYLVLEGGEWKWITEEARNLGGIDFRNLPLVRKAIGNLKPDLDSSSMDRLNSMNLDIEWRDIENSVNSGVIPQAERLKEYIQASCLKGNADKDIDKVISCIADILRIEEERYVSTEPLLQYILIAVESANSVQQLKAAFIGTAS